MPENSFSIDTLLEQMVAHNASDLHVTVGSQPALRVRGQLERLEAFPELSADTTRQLLYRIISSEQQKRLEIDRQLDLSYSIPGLARFRVNIYSQRESLAAAFRMIPAELPPIFMGYNRAGATPERRPLARDGSVTRTIRSSPSASTGPGPRGWRRPSDPAPHWGSDFVRWPHYGTFLEPGGLNWVTGRERATHETHLRGLAEHALGPPRGGRTRVELVGRQAARPGARSASPNTATTASTRSSPSSRRSRDDEYPAFADEFPAASARARPRSSATSARTRPSSPRATSTARPASRPSKTAIDAAAHLGAELRLHAARRRLLRPAAEHPAVAARTRGRRPSARSSEVADHAADQGVNVSVELLQGSIVNRVALLRA